MLIIPVAIVAGGGGGGHGPDRARQLSRPSQWPAGRGPRGAGLSTA
jgi:hypothetical protein